MATSDAVRESKLIEQRIQSVRQFRVAFAEALQLADEGLITMLGERTRRPSPRNVEYLEHALHRLGELAGSALAAAGDVQSGITRYGHSYLPMMQWRDPFEPEGGLATPNEILDSCDMVIGILDQRLAYARLQEATWAYRFGRLLTFPHRARQAAGANDAVGHIAFWLAVAVEVLAGLVLLVVPVALGLIARALT